MGSRPRSPTAYPEDPWDPQDGGPGPAKRRRTEEPARPKSESEAAPSLDNLTWSPTAGTLIFVAVLPAGCALHVLLDDVELLLEPEPTSVRQVCLGGRILMLVPEALVGSGAEGPWGQGLEPGALLSPREIACQGGASKEDANADADFLLGEMDAASVPVAGLRSSAASLTHFDLLDLVSEPSPRASNPSPERGSPQHADSLDLHLLEPFPPHHSNLYLLLRVQVARSAPVALLVFLARPGDACSLNPLPPTIPGHVNGHQGRVFRCWLCIY
ncbi:proline-rich protein 23B-like [Dama dama]|uniref:proline-rich protein 23B-like n=1 Tax=Dama dama TaxID=30532 RepID=UPI002A371993|nr:proline-rich protein 23B-like [Dama dama]